MAVNEYHTYILCKLGNDNISGSLTIMAIFSPQSYYWGISNPLSVPLVAREMRKAKFSNNDIEIVTFYNTFDFFKQSPRFTWSP
jgi:hypothetical protein